MTEPESYIVGTAVRPWGPANTLLVWDWIHAPLSDENKLFRLRAIGTAFGLSKRYMLWRYAAPDDEHRQGMGCELEKELVWWIRLHPNLQQNDPLFAMTDWADLDMDSD